MKRSKKGKHYFTQISNGIKYTYFIKKIKIKNKYYTITAKSKEDWDLKYENYTDDDWNDYMNNHFMPLYCPKHHKKRQDYLAKAGK